MISLQVPLQLQNNNPGRMRIAPVSSAMIMSARSRDPRLLRQQASAAGHSQRQDQRMQQPVLSLSGGSLARSLPRIPKFSQSNNYNKPSRDNDERNRDPRNRRNKEDSSGNLKSKSSPSSKDKNKSSLKSPSSRSNDRKKSGSSDDSSPRKKNEDEKKSSKSPSSHHRTSHSSKSPSKSSTNIDIPAKDVDLRMVPGIDITMKPDSTTSHTKSNKDKLLSDLLNDEDMKSSHEMITDDNGKENKPILVVTINIQRFIVTIL